MIPMSLLGVTLSKLSAIFNDNQLKPSSMFLFFIPLVKKYLIGRFPSRLTPIASTKSSILGSPKSTLLNMIRRGNSLNSGFPAISCNNALASGNLSLSWTSNTNINPS